ncbi:class I SAM-dependent methyltransferase [Devosia sp. 1566]|uniref:class I SAM-dependent methyltransferase n=1 Tax=Devosia sp. 1566 TaxID=2499144 RepID=UPI000FDAD911|nr:class I SAM-dependent methyltransferase [Devosia sp. 1566]
MTNSPIDAGAGPIGLYERMGERATQPFAIQLLDQLMPLDGLAVIDVASGTGGLAVAAAERDAWVTATDISPDMVARSAERLRSFKNARAGVMDFRSLGTAGASYDIAISHFGILAFPTWRLGLDELLRVTRRQGRVGLTMWTQEDDCSPAHLMRRVFAQLHPDRELWPAGMFPTFSQDELRESLLEAGCSTANIHVAQADWSPYSSPDVVSECDPMFRGFPGYAALSPDEGENLREALQQAFNGYADAQGIIRLPTRAFMIVAASG